MKSTLSKVLIGAFVILAARGYAYKKFQTYKKKIQQGKSSILVDQAHQGIGKLIRSKFLIQLEQLINIRTLSEGTVEDLSRMFSPSGKCQIDIYKPKQQRYLKLEKISVRRTAPNGPEDCQRINLKQGNKKLFAFYDTKRFQQMIQRQYEFYDIQIKRPSDTCLEQILRDLIKKQ